MLNLLISLRKVPMSTGNLKTCAEPLDEVVRLLIGISLRSRINISPHWKGTGLFGIPFTVKGCEPVFFVKKGKAFVILNIGIRSKDTAGDKAFIALVGNVP